MKLKKVKFNDLNARQQENYNYQKIAAKLAEYGYYCMWLNDDWQGADFIANHISGKLDEFLKVQLKGRLTINRKYIGKGIYIAFRSNDDIYLYPHDEVMKTIARILPRTTQTVAWKDRGGYAWPGLPKKLRLALERYKL